jgi:hypothetical protein
MLLDLSVLIGIKRAGRVQCYLLSNLLALHRSPSY